MHVTLVIRSVLEYLSFGLWFVHSIDGPVLIIVKDDAPNRGVVDASFGFDLFHSELVHGVQLQHVGPFFNRDALSLPILVLGGVIPPLIEFRRFWGLNSGRAALAMADTFLVPVTLTE